MNADQETAMAAAKEVEKVPSQLRGKEMKKIVHASGHVLTVTVKQSKLASLV